MASGTAVDSLQPAAQPAEIEVGSRMRMPARADGGPCVGVVFVVSGERLLFCYDDRVWESMQLSYVRSHASCISALEVDEDVKGERIHT
eukprot:377114-Pleurochrysis_carterae.AAC.1